MFQLRHARHTFEVILSIFVRGNERSSTIFEIWTGDLIYERKDQFIVELIPNFEYVGSFEVFQYFNIQWERTIGALGLSVTWNLCSMRGLIHEKTHSRSHWWLWHRYVFSYFIFSPLFTRNITVFASFNWGPRRYHRPRSCLLTLRCLAVVHSWWGIQHSRLLPTPPLNHYSDPYNSILVQEKIQRHSSQDTTFVSSGWFELVVLCFVHGVTSLRLLRNAGGVDSWLTLARPVLGMLLRRSLTYNLYITWLMSSTICRSYSLVVPLTWRNSNSEGLGCLFCGIM